MQKFNTENYDATMDNLSPALLSRITQVRSDEADGYINTEMADRHIRAIIGFATGKAKDIDWSRRYAACDGIYRIGAHINNISEFVSRKMFDQGGDFPLGTSLDAADAGRIIAMLEAAKASLDEIEGSVTILCAS